MRVALAILAAACCALAFPAAPAGVGHEDTADPPAGVPAYVDWGQTNQRNDPCMVTIDTNAGVRVVKGFLDIWTPSTLLVDAGVTLAAKGNCSAVVASTWSGIPGDATDGKVKNAAVHRENIAYVERVTKARTAAEATLVYLDDRRGKGYSMVDSLGPLTAAWIAGTKQTTTLTAIPADAATATSAANDGGNNLGVGSTTNPDLGLVVDFINAMSTDASTEPAKRFYKYGRPYRWSANVSVLPELVPAKSTTPKTDSGYISGHSAEAWRDALGMAYVVPERYHEILTRAMELSENRIKAGMHSALDTQSGRIQAIAVVTYSIYKSANRALGAQARAQALAFLQKQLNLTSQEELLAKAHSAPLSQDRFADYHMNRDLFRKVMTHDFTQIAATDVPAVVPKGVEILLETRLPYLTPAQRRVVIKSTAYPSGYPIMDDDEGYGRLDLFAAGAGYGAFAGDVHVDMNATLGGFHALDTWRNNIAGPGKLTKDGTGVLHLAGNNAFSGGVEVLGGQLVADTPTALGIGAAWVAAGATLKANTNGLVVHQSLSLRPHSTLEVMITSSVQTPVQVSQWSFIQGSTLRVQFPGSYKPARGEWIWVLQSHNLLGFFDHIHVEGFKVVLPVYTFGSLRLHLLF